MNSCANCCTVNQHLYFEFSSWIDLNDVDQDQDQQLTKINLQAGFNIIFERRLFASNKFKKSKPATADTEEDQQPFRMCAECTTVLSELYRSYLQFMKLTKHGSAVHAKLWQQQPTIISSIPNVNPKDCASLEPESSSDQEEEVESKFLILKQEDLLGNNYQEEEVEEIIPFLSNDDDDENTLQRQDNNKSKLKHSCSSCSKIFPSFLQLKYHPCSSGHHHKPKNIATKQKKSKTTFKSSAKSASDTKTIKMRKHILTDDGAIIYTCRHCPETFPSRYKARLHRGSAHPATLPQSTTKSTYSCTATNCSKIFHTESRLAYHLVTSHNIGPRLPTQQCPSCPAYFPLPSRMKTHHRNVHTDKGKYPCPVPTCKSTSPNRSALQSHLRNVHEHTTKSHMCEVCGKTYKAARSLQDHVSLVHGQTPPKHKCQICGKGSSSTRGIQKHMDRCHNDCRVRDVPCQQCPKYFYDDLELKKHVKNVHSEFGPKPWGCGECGARFAQQVGLRRHTLAVHDHDKGGDGHGGPFQCMICGKEFKFKDYLRQHVTRTQCHGGAGKRNRQKKTMINT